MIWPRDYLIVAFSYVVAIAVLGVSRVGLGWGAPELHFGASMAAFIASAALGSRTDGDSRLLSARLHGRFAALSTLVIFAAITSHLCPQTAPCRMTRGSYLPLVLPPFLISELGICRANFEHRPL